MWDIFILYYNLLSIVDEICNDFGEVSEVQDGITRGSYMTGDQADVLVDGHTGENVWETDNGNVTEEYWTYDVRTYIFQFSFFLFVFS